MITKRIAATRATNPNGVASPVCSTARQPRWGWRRWAAVVPGEPPCGRHPFAMLDSPVGANTAGSRLSEDQIDDPATADVFARLPAVVQDVGVVAAGVFEGVRQDRQAVEGTFFID